MRGFKPMATLDAVEATDYASARAEGRMAAGALAREESPDSTRQRCRVTPGRGNPTESATEIRPPCFQGKGETVG